MARKIIIDTDPGQDDAVAILFALGSPELEVLALTTVAGNVPLDQTRRNARIVLEIAGRGDIPVYAGCDAPLARPLVTAEHVHGKTGLDGIDLFEPAAPLADGHAVDALIRILREEPAGSVTATPSSLPGGPPASGAAAAWPWGIAGPGAGWADVGVAGPAAGFAGWAAGAG